MWLYGLCYYILVRVQCCFPSTQTVRTIRAQHDHLDCHTAPVPVQCCFTSTETIRTVRDGEHRAAISTFTQYPNSGYYSILAKAILISKIAVSMRSEMELSMAVEGGAGGGGGNEELCNRGDHCWSCTLGQRWRTGKER